jgi:glycosyltransferase involved in cell wall biosynthesis
MKICFYNVTASYKTGGLETYCWEVGHALAQKGHDVTIVAGTGGKQRYEDVRLIEFPFKERDRFIDLGTRFRKLSERISFGIHSWRHLLEKKYDAIIINKPFDMPVIWWAKKNGLNSVVAFRSGGADFFFGDKLFKSAIDIWLSSSNYNAKQISNHYKVNVHVIHNGVDINKFYPRTKSESFRKKLGIPQESFIIMSVGRLIGWKGLNLIIDILPHLKNCYYIVVGNGPAHEQLKKQANELKVSNRIHFLGEIPHKNLPEILPEADIFVQPSIGEEAFGITLVEAMACGIPVCASNIGGMPEIVINGETGLLLPPGDRNAWRIAIQTLLKKSDMMKEMAIKARNRVVKHFTWSANAEQLENILKDKIGE